MDDNDEITVSTIIMRFAMLVTPPWPMIDTDSGFAAGIEVGLTFAVRHPALAAQVLEQLRRDRSDTELGRGASEQVDEQLAPLAEALTFAIGHA